MSFIPNRQTSILNSLHKTNNLGDQNINKLAHSDIDPDTSQFQDQYHHDYTPHKGYNEHDQNHANGANSNFGHNNSGNFQNSLRSQNSILSSLHNPNQHMQSQNYFHNHLVSKKPHF